MGQYYVFANVTKLQSMHSMLQKASEILVNRSYLPWLQLFLVDLRDEGIKQSSLASNEEQFPPGSSEQLPKALEKKLDLTFLSEQLVGKWAGDRLIITGDYSDYSPFPPHGEWKSGNLFDFVYESGQFSNSHISEIRQRYDETTLMKKLEKFSEGKLHKVVNLDKKEYLDPQAYGAGEKTVCDMVRSCSNRKHGVMAGLIISLIHSTGHGGGDIDVASVGMWAGDRIVICTAEQLADFESYTDVSNPIDVEKVLSRCFGPRP